MFQYTWTFIPTLTWFFIVLTRNFPTIFITIMLNQSFRLSNSSEAIFGIHLYSHYRIHIRTSPIKIHPFIIIFKECRIMLRKLKLCIYFFPSVLFRMSVFINTGVSTGCRKIKSITINKDGRSIIFHRWNGCTRDIFPFCQVFRTPVSTGFRGKHIIVSFKIFQYRISRFTP